MSVSAVTVVIVVMLVVVGGTVVCLKRRATDRHVYTSPKTEPANENASNYTELTTSAAVATAEYANVDVDRQPRSDSDQTYVNTTAGMMTRRV